MKRSIISLAFILLIMSVRAQENLPVKITLSKDQYNEVEKVFKERQRVEKWNSDWAQFNRYAADDNSMKKPAKVVFMGNSITDNWYRMHPDFFVKNGFTGRGISGQTTSEMLVRFQSDVIDLKPKVVVILAGINDLAQNNGTISHKHIMQNIQSMCELAAYHKIKPVLCSITPSCQFSWHKDLTPAKDIREVNEMIRKYAKENGFTYVDYYSALVDERGGLPEKYSNDGVHPTLDGYAIMEKIVLKSINKLVKN